MVQDNVAARNTQINANLDVVQDNVASIISGATSFTGNVTLQTTNDGSTATPILILDRQTHGQISIQIYPSNLSIKLS